MALGALLTAAWRKPVVQSVVLPAHAQTSVSGGCVVAVSGGFTQGIAISSRNESLSAFVNGTVLRTTSGYGSASVSGSSTFPSGTYVAGVSISLGSDTAGTASLVVSRCDASLSTSGAPSNSYATAEGHFDVSVGDDGECLVTDIL